MASERRHAHLDPSGRTPVHQLGKIKIAGSNYRLLDLGDWSATNPDTSARDYVPGNVVSSGGLQYLCILAHSNQIPPNGTYWELYEPAKRSLNAERVWAKNSDGLHAVLYDLDLQSDTFLYVGTSGVVSEGDTFGMHFVAANAGILFQQGVGEGANYSSLSLGNTGSDDGTIFLDSTFVLLNVVDSFKVRNSGATDTLFQVDADGTIHGRASVGSITWDLVD